MAIFRSTPHPSQDPLSSLRTPATKRISASQRLSTILESNRNSDLPAPTVPLRSILRNKGGATATPMSQHPAFRSQETLQSGPPAYGNNTSSIAESEDLTAPVEGEKLAQLRRGQEKRSRGGWKRLAVIVAIVLVVIGLAVGLGVGLTVGRRSSSSSDSSGSSSGSDNATESEPQFPLGQYSFVTALRTQQTNCTSEASSWRCYPYTTFAQSNQTSLATFNWILSNTSDSYATHDSGSTSSAGMPANMSISSTNNAFSIVFSNQNLTYISDGNSSTARYTFSFPLQKVVIPSPAITSDNSVSRCYYNSTMLEGTIWLNKTRSYPDSALFDSTNIGGYDQWPYAVDVAQVSPGGDGIPDCYKTVNGVDGDRIIKVLTAQPASSECVCDYRNF